MPTVGLRKRKFLQALAVLNLTAEYEAAIRSRTPELGIIESEKHAYLDFKPKADEYWALQKRPLPKPKEPEDEDAADGLELLPLNFFQGKEASRPENIKWVANHYMLKVTAKKAPSGIAWGYLVWARRNPDKFWELYTKTKDEDEALRRMDDGREVLQTISQMEHAVKEQEVV